MSETRLPSYQTAAPAPSQTTTESDDEFLNRQFQSSIQALERVQALSPGEFDRLVHTSVRTEEERRERATHHEDIARRALIAAQHGLLSEEDFNIWSGRRKEAGQPVKYRFERAYANVSTPLIACKRGALTGIVRAYVRLQDELIAELIAEGESLQSADDLLALEQQAVKYGFLEFEHYTGSPIAGWPSFPRSTGRFRGSTRLRQFCEQRQAELPLSPESVEALLRMIAAKTTTVRETAAVYTSNEPATPFIKRLFQRLTRFFR